MSNRTSAVRYARALLDVVRKEGDVDAAERDLASFVSLVDGDARLHRALTSPAVPAPRKKALVAELLRRAPLQATVAKLLLLLADRDRLVLLPELLEEYRERLLDLQNIVRAEVTTAVPLGVDRVKELQRAFGAVTGRRVAMTTCVDPAIIGGVITRIGSVVYDGSVRRQLERMRETLAGG